VKKILISLIVLSFIFTLGCESLKTNVKLEVKACLNETEPDGSGDNRLQAIYVEGFKDDLAIWKEIEDYAKKLTWSEGDLNIVFFFDDKDGTPGNEITLAPDFVTALEFPAKYEKYCVAKYWHFPYGKEQFIKYPFKEGK